MIIVPAYYEPELVCEVKDFEWIFTESLVAYNQSPNSLYKEYEFNGFPYRINIANDRYVLFNQQRTCVCCGIRGTRMFLCTFEKDGVQGFTFHFFAESRDRKDQESHLVIMTKDHILPRNEGGTDHIDNYQTLCYLCNSMRNQLGVSVQQIQSSLFTAYRIYRGTLTLRKTKDKLESQYSKLKGMQRGVEDITLGLDKVKSEVGREKMLQKCKGLKEEIDFMSKKLIEIEIDAQTKGITYDEDHTS